MSNVLDASTLASEDLPLQGAGHHLVQLLYLIFRTKMVVVLNLPVWNENCDVLQNFANILNKILPTWKRMKAEYNDKAFSDSLSCAMVLAHSKV